MIFTNARLIFPDGIRDGLDIVVEEKKIAAIHPPTPRLRRIGERLREEEVIDLNGNYLAPGFIDLHVHGALGRDTMEGHVESLAQIAKFHLAGGTTAMAPLAGFASAFASTFALVLFELLADFSRLMTGIVAPAGSIAQPGTLTNSRYSFSR